MFDIIYSVSYVTLPWIHCRSSSQTSYRKFDRQKETFSEKIIEIPSNKLNWITLLPSDVNFAAGFEDPGRNVGAVAFVRHHHVGVIGPVESFVSTEIRFMKESVGMAAA